MAPLTLEGDTLGKRHQHYNQLLKKAVSDQVVSSEIDYGKADVDNLFNIDVAAKNRNVDYILQVLKCDDMLYVSRAIKRSTWLITDSQYAHIINPEYLHSQLFPHMLAQASNKLTLHVRLHLRDETRVENFYNYYADKHLKTAFKWLPHCSIAVIEQAVQTHGEKIPSEILSRLYERSFSVFEIFMRVAKSYRLEEEAETANFFLHNHTEQYFEIILKLKSYQLPNFSKKYTEIVMKKCPQRFIDNFEKFYNRVDLGTFIKYFKKNELKSFIMKQLKNKNIKTWFNQDRMNHFIKHLPKEERFEFTKQLIDNTFEDVEDDIPPQSRLVRQCMTMKCSSRIIPCSSSKTYNWYKHAPFDVAFAELQKMIRSESSADERNAMLMVLIITTRRNPAHIQTLLEYYRKKHINEPFKYKIQFVNYLLSKSDIHKYNELSWNILEEIFRSMEVYVESDNNTQSCIKAIVIYKIIHDEPIPDIIEKKFVFDSLKSSTKKLNEEQKTKVFDYLYKKLFNNLQNKNITDASEFTEYRTLIENILNFLNDWHKDLINYPEVLQKIKEVAKMKKEKAWKVSLFTLYTLKKSWRKHMFEESFCLSPTQEVCMNVLKHDPALFMRLRDEVKALSFIDSMSMERVLSKIRVYFPEEMTSEWVAKYRERLNKPGGHKYIIRGLASLLQKKAVQDLIKEFEPQETKIDWSNSDEQLLSIRKNIAKNIHIARPQPNIEAILCFAKGDYVQYTQPSLNAILHNLRSEQSKAIVLKLLDAPISLQKHGIHLAFTKLSTTDMQKLFSDIWKSTKNSSIRSLLFQNTHRLLCKERNNGLVQELWSLLQLFIENLTSEENKMIYDTLGDLEKVPSSIKPQYCMKSYKFLKSLPAKNNCETVIRNVKAIASKIAQELDPIFITELLSEFVEKTYFNTRVPHYDTDFSFLTSYLLYVDDEKTQNQRYIDVLEPLLDKSFSSLNDVKANVNQFRLKFNLLFDTLIRSVIGFSYLKNKISPTLFLRNIQSKLEKFLPVKQNYCLLTKWRLAVRFFQVFESYKPSITKLNESSDSGLFDSDCGHPSCVQLNNFYYTIIPEIVENILQQLKTDIRTFSPFIYGPFATAMNETVSLFSFNTMAIFKCSKHLLKDKDPINYLMVIGSLEEFYHLDDEEKAEYKGILEMLSSHPAVEVNILYYQKFGHLIETYKNDA